MNFACFSNLKQFENRFEFGAGLGLTLALCDSLIPVRSDRRCGPLDLSWIGRPRLAHTGSVSDLFGAIGSRSHG
jgi:hypothetical protein